jgi:hypothetical protein
MARSENTRVISLRLVRAADGKFKISLRETRDRTKRMIAFDKSLSISFVTIDKNLDDLLYSKRDKQDLKGLIDRFFFSDVAAIADKEDLGKAKTVGDLILKIYDNYIPSENKE